MAQNSSRLTWAPETVDQKLKDIMKECYENCYNVGTKYPAEDDKASNEVPSLVAGANIAGFQKVADAMVSAFPPLPFRLCWSRHT